jgi:hypothetical protein
MIGWIADCFYAGVAGLWHYACLLPFPSPSDIFKGIVGSFISFLVLWWPRYKLDAVAKQKYLHDHKRRPAPSSTEHQQAAASVGVLFEHH